MVPSQPAPQGSLIAGFYRMLAGKTHELAESAGVLVPVQNGRMIAFKPADSPDPKEVSSCLAKLVQLLRSVDYSELTGKPCPFDLGLSDLASLSRDAGDLEGLVRASPQLHELVDCLEIEFKALKNILRAVIRPVFAQFEAAKTLLARVKAFNLQDRAAGVTVWLTITGHTSDVDLLCSAVNGMLDQKIRTRCEGDLLPEDLGEFTEYEGGVMPCKLSPPLTTALKLPSDRRIRRLDLSGLRTALCKLADRLALIAKFKPVEVVMRDRLAAFPETLAEFRQVGFEAFAGQLIADLNTDFDELPQSANLVVARQLMLAAANAVTAVVEWSPPADPLISRLIAVHVTGPERKVRACVETVLTEFDTLGREHTERLAELHRYEFHRDGSRWSYRAPAAGARRTEQVEEAAVA